MGYGIFYFTGCNLFEGLDNRKACNAVNSIATRPTLQGRNFVHNIHKGKHFCKCEVDTPLTFVRDIQIRHLDMN